MKVIGNSVCSNEMGTEKNQHPNQTRVVLTVPRIAALALVGVTVTKHDRRTQSEP